MSVVDFDGNYVRVNSSYCKTFGYTIDEFSRMKVSDLTHPEDREETNQHRDRLAQNRPVNPTITKRYVKKDGEVVHAIVHVTIYRSPDESVRCFIVQIQDITEIKRAQESLVLHSKMAALGEMAAGIAHEVNNPLTIVKGYADLMVMNLSKDEPRINEIREWASMISSTSIRMSKIINGLRSFAREDAYEDFQPCTVGEVLDDAFAFSLERIKNKGILLEVDGDRETVIQCNRVGISQVLLNLLNNALHAVGDQASKWIRIVIRRSESSLVISVMDSGGPIPPEFRSRIMDPFFTTKAPGEGSGLGLSVSRSIMLNHRGDLILDADAEFTKFDLILPRQN